MVCQFLLYAHHLEKERKIDIMIKLQVINCDIKQNDLI